MANITAEIRLSFDYFYTEKNLPVARIYLMGEGVYFPEAEPVFAGNFDIPLAVWNALEKFPAAQEAAGVLQEGRRMAVALGLALSAYD